MNDNWTDKWNNRYKAEEFAYGVEPNNYLKKQLNQLTVGSILFPAEGEGRNAVYAAILGWKVYAFDISIEGRNKALRLAERKRVEINYQIGELKELNYIDNQFDAIALIYAHFPAEIKSRVHRELDQYLRKGGMIIFEAFSKRHIEYLAVDDRVGGPKDIESLFSEAEIMADFNNYEVIELREEEIELNEGSVHVGKGSVIRFVGKKK
ncbi:MAG: class I SAM-dependent methyltransferase [Bacteroidales bacterium]|nr:class I SAM-dependent methyltransferase [Bacteroidales bacterium]